MVMLIHPADDHDDSDSDDVMITTTVTMINKDIAMIEQESGSLGLSLDRYK